MEIEEGDDDEEIKFTNLSKVEKLDIPTFRLAMVRKGRSDDRETAQSSSAAFSGDGRETFSSLDEPQLVGMKEAWERSAGARYKAVYRTDLLPPRGASRCIVMTKEQGTWKRLCAFGTHFFFSGVR